MTKTISASCPDAKLIIATTPEEARKNSPHYEIAARIARDLFTDGFGNLADRLVMKHLENGKERDGAGWCESAVANRIADTLKANGWTVSN